MLEEVKNEFKDNNKLYGHAEGMQRKINFKNNFKDPINYRYQKRREQYVESS